MLSDAYRSIERLIAGLRREDTAELPAGGLAQLCDEVFAGRELNHAGVNDPGPTVRRLWQSSVNLPAETTVFAPVDDVRQLLREAAG